MGSSLRLRVVALASFALVPAACGSSGSAASSSSAPAPVASTPSTSGGAGSAPAGTSGPTSGPASGGNVLSAESVSAAAGDIPDNQVFLVFVDQKAGYSLKYPEGWAQKGDAGDVTFRDKNNIVHVVITTAGTPPTPASVALDLERARTSQPSLRVQPPVRANVHGASAIKVSYTTTSAPNAVTGKRVSLTVDRYVFAHAGRVATIDLGSPRGVDNVDAYRLMIESFRWTR